MRSWLLWASGVIAGGALVSSVACGGNDSSTAKGGGGSGGQTQAGGGGNTSTQTTDTNGGGGTAGGGGGTGGSGGTFVPMCEDTPNDTIFAIDSLIFGANDANAWKTTGFDLDGTTSVGDCSITGQCAISAGGKAKFECTDGTAGIDNSFAQVIIPFLTKDMINIDDQANMSLKAGQFTVMLDVQKLADGTDPQGPLVMNVYNGGDLGKAPAFDGTDCWPVTPESLTNPSKITSAKASFTMTNVAADHVASGTIDSLPLAVETPIGLISLNIHAARVEFNLTPTHDQLINGIIGGVLDETELLDTVQGAIYTHFGGGSAGAGFCHLGDDTIAGSVDVMDDPTSGSSATTCNGISFGVGFTAKLVKFGGIVPATPPTKNDCPAN